LVLIKANLLDRDLGSGVWELGGWELGFGIWDLGWGVGLWGFSGSFLFYFILFLRLG
jgi:hypothetical protein